MTPTPRLWQADVKKAVKKRKRRASINTVASQAEGEGASSSSNPAGDIGVDPQLGASSRSDVGGGGGADGGMEVDGGGGAGGGVEVDGAEGDSMEVDGAESEEGEGESGGEGASDGGAGGDGGGGGGGAGGDGGGGDGGGAGGSGSSGGAFSDGYLRGKFKSDNIDSLHGDEWGYTEDAYKTYKNLLTVSGDIVTESDRIKVCLHPP